MKKENLIMPITIILTALILGGSYYAVQYNKQQSIERQQKINLETEERLKQKEREQTEAKEDEQKGLLEDCLNEAKKYYWEYMGLNGTEKAGGSIYADDKFWDRAEKNRQEAFDNCFEQYKNKSFIQPQGFFSGGYKRLFDDNGEPIKLPSLEKLKQLEDKFKTATTTTD